MKMNIKRASFLLAFLYFTDLFCTSLSYSCLNPLPTTQYNALYSLYNATDGPHWCIDHPWNFSTSVSPYASCEDGWEGITCLCSNDTYTISELNMRVFCMKGKLPHEISGLHDLTRLNFSINLIHGSIPSSISNFHNLSEIDIGFNYLTSSIPYEICQLTTLTKILLDRNFISGDIPPCIGNLTNLVTLVLSNNTLENTLPTTLYNLSSLVTLYLSDNAFQGSFSRDFSRLSNLEILVLYSNQFTNQLPDIVYNMASLKYLNLAGNRFSGSLSPRFGDMNLLALSLSNNMFTGTIPCALFTAPYLSFIVLSENEFHGGIPNCINNTDRLEVFAIADSRITGTIPAALFNISSLKILFLNNNYMHGSLPLTIGSQPAMQFLSLYANEFTGMIPKQVFNATGMTELYIDTNQMTGSVPLEIGKLTRLRALTLYDNMLTGSLPPEMFVSPYVHFILMAKNMLTGSVPIEIKQTSLLIVLSLHQNFLTGPLPDFPILPFVRLASFYSNMFSSTLPSLVRLPYLEEILVNDNQLTGNLDQVFDSTIHKYLRAINVAENYFSGSLPSAWFEMQSLHGLSAASNCFRSSLPTSICNLHNHLEVLNFDGIGSKVECALNRKLNDNKPPFMDGEFSVLGLNGNIPSCLFAFPVLQVVHLSSNLLDGTLPEISNGSMIAQLTISNNILTGTIPLSIQRRPFHILDIANNRLQGTLVSDFALNQDQVSLSLAVNRLSGPLPDSFKNFYSSNLTNMNILASNIFSCTSSEIPQQDVYANSYSCDSSELNIASYIWLGFLFVSCMIGMTLYLVWHYFHESPTSPSYYVVHNIRIFIRQLDQWRLIASCIQSCSHPDSKVPISKLYELNVNFLLIPQETLIELNAYFIALTICLRWTRNGGLFLLFVFIPAYCVMNVFCSIVSYEYAYTLSMAFLHGIVPTIFIGFIIATLLILLSIVLNILLAMFTQNMGKSESPSTQDPSISFRVKRYGVMAALHIINVAVTVIVNASYVNAILEDNNITQSGLLFVQMCLGLFKILWNAIYIPWCSHRLRPYMSQARSMQNRLTMSITNFIIAPILATAAVNQSCFYFVVQASTPSTASIDLRICTFPAICSKGFCCAFYENLSFVTTSSKSFQYSYACGTALLVSYTPVLLYSYISYGFLLPIYRYIRARYAVNLVKMYARIFNRSNDLDGRVRGVDIIINIKLHLAVLLTFGFASTILGMAIVVAIFNDYLTSKILAGRYIAINYPLLSISSIASNSVDSNMNPMQSIDSSDDRSRVVSTASRTLSRSLEKQAFDIKDSWRGLFASYSIVTVTVSIFWGLLFFDMIADRYGVVGGVTTSLVFAVAVSTIALSLFWGQGVIKWRIVKAMKLEQLLYRMFNMGSLTLSSNLSKVAAQTVVKPAEIEMRSSNFN